MAGGNDGLNTLVPFVNDDYRRARPKLALPADVVLKLNDSLGLHPALTGLKALYDAGQLAIVQGVGYPNPNRSHHRSTAIWQTASNANKVAPHGWIGRYFDQAYPEGGAPAGIHLDQQMPQAFASHRPQVIGLYNLQQHQFSKSDRPSREELDLSETTFQKLNQPQPGEHNQALSYVQRVAAQAQSSSLPIQAAAARSPKRQSYPSGKLAVSLSLAARLIAGGMPTRVYYVCQRDYDTHANQLGNHQRLLKNLGDSIAAFCNDLQAQGNFDRVLLMTFSEFGRRVAENGSGGTDHGAGSVLFIAGGKVNPGLLGAHPSLAPNDLHRGDLQSTVDFRSVYAGILEGWLGTASPSILGRRFKPLPVTA
jgi:uncharacterized protein (DUF1501 family)